MCMLFSTLLWCPLHDYNRKPPKSTFYGGCERTMTIFFPFSYFEPVLSPELNSRKNHLQSTPDNSNPQIKKVCVIRISMQLTENKEISKSMGRECKYHAHSTSRFDKWAGPERHNENSSFCDLFTTVVVVFA